MKFNHLLIVSEEHRAIITINRPKKLNALNKELIDELAAAIDSFDKNTDIRYMIITGAGDKAFVAGADIAEFANFDAAEGSKLAAEGQQRLFSRIENSGTPVIAAINGYALGGGLELALACHLRVGVPEARMGLPEVSLGLIPGYGGTQRLPQIIGKGRALEIMLATTMITADTAEKWGLLNAVRSKDELLPYCIKLGQKIARNAPTAVQSAIAAVNSGFQTEGFAREIDLFGSCFDTADFKEGTSAFLQKRTARFTGK